MFEDVRDLYQEVILDRGRHPRHAQRLDAFDATAKGDNPMCGDRVQVWVKHNDQGAVSDVGFEARGCAISIASADLMAEAAIGHTATTLRKLSADFAQLVTSGDCPDCAGLETLQPLSGVSEFPSRVKCATLPWHALLSAIDAEPGHG